MKKQNIQLMAIENYKGCELFCPCSTECDGCDLNKKTEAARLYVDIIHALYDRTFTKIDVCYAWRNIPYLDREIGETDSIFRIFVPFESEDAIVKNAREVAVFRGLLDFADFAATDEEMRDLRDLLFSMTVDELNEEQMQTLYRLLKYNPASN